MSAAVAAAALAVAGGAVVAVSARDPRVALLGLTFALVGAPLLADPLPDPAILAVRIFAALLVLAILRAAAIGPDGRPRPGVDSGSQVGWAAELGFVLAGALVGMGAAASLAALSSGPPTGVGAPATLDPTTAAIMGIGTALLAIGVGADGARHLGLRATIGLVLIVQAVLLLRVGLAGVAADLEEVAWAGLLVVAAAMAPLRLDPEPGSAGHASHPAGP